MKTLGSKLPFLCDYSLVSGCSTQPRSGIPFTATLTASRLMKAISIHWLLLNLIVIAVGLSFSLTVLIVHAVLGKATWNVVWNTSGGYIGSYEFWFFLFIGSVKCENVYQFWLEGMWDDDSRRFYYSYTTWYVYLDLRILELNTVSYCNIVMYNRASYNTTSIMT